MPSTQKAFADDRLRGVTIEGSLTPEDIAVIKSWNVNIVRYLIIWDDRTNFADAGEYSAWLQTALDEFNGKASSF